MNSGLIDLRYYISSSSYDNIKAKFFLYESLTTYTFEQFKDLQLNTGYGKKSYYDKIQLLVDQGLLTLCDPETLNSPTTEEGITNYVQIIDLLNSERNRIKNLEKKKNSSESNFALTKANFQYMALEERLFALLHREQFKVNTLPVTSLDSYETLDLLFPKSNVYRVLINSFPIPDDSVPLADIIQYRNDERNKLNLLRLHNWVKNISDKHLTESEIAEEIEIMIAEYKREMQLAGMKYKNARLEFIVKLIPTSLEKILKLSLSELFDPFFKLRHEKISLLEAENRAKGNELAYIIKAE